MEGGVSWGGKMGFKIHKMDLLTNCAYLAVLVKHLTSVRSLSFFIYKVGIAT